MISVEEVRNALRPRFGTVLTEDPGFSEGAADLLRRFAPYRDTFASLTAQMEEFLRQLTKERRAIFLGRFWFMYSVSEIAAQMGKDEKYISNQLYNMKKKLKRYLKRKD